MGSFLSGKYFVCGCFSRRSARYRPLLLMEAVIDDDAKM